MDHLDESSRRFAERLFARFPRWRDLASTESSTPRGRFRGDPGTLRVDVESPSGDPDRLLTFFLAEGEASLGFGDWHTHASSNDPPDVDALLSLAADVVSDRRLFLVQRGYWTLIDEPVEEAIEGTLTDPEGPDEVRVVSWSGLGDRTIRRSDRSR
jgi:hypothetical protein